MSPATTPLETVRLSDTASGAEAWVAPARGGLVTRFSAAGRPVLFLDESTLLDPKKNVRGGVPVLFPSPGKLVGERYSRDGKSGALGQHGFARNLPWAIDAQSASAVTLRLDATPETRAQFPWEFVLRYRISVSGSTAAAVLRIDQRIENPGASPLPFGCGFHPYFHVPQGEKAAARVETTATRAWDNAAGREVRLGGPIDLTLPEVDLHLIDHPKSNDRSEAALSLAGGARILVSGSPALGRWVVWTLAGKDFVCLEPWSGPANGLNTGVDLLVAAPGSAIELWTEIRFTR
jgi:galactose mutarotase-like enzyme